MTTLEARVAKLEKRLSIARNPATDRAMQEMALDLMRFVAPMDPVGLGFERVGRDFDGGYVMAAGGPAARVAYSLGINRDVSWDMAIAERGCLVFQYDHTIEALPARHKNFRFFRKGIAGNGQPIEPPFTSVEREIVANGHGETRDMLLKLDIEGAEWAVFADMGDADRARFSQIVMEAHGFDRLHKLPWYRVARAALQNLHRTHQVVHVHGNNNSAMRVLGGVPVPPTLELTWLRRDVCAFAPCSRRFPTALDQPNNPNFADLLLGDFRFDAPPVAP